MILLIQQRSDWAFNCLIKIALALFLKLEASVVVNCMEKSDRHSLHNVLICVAQMKESHAGLQ